MERSIKTSVRVLIFLTCLFVIGAICLSIYLYSSPRQILAPDKLTPNDVGWTYEEDGQEKPLVPGERISWGGPSFTMSKDIVLGGINGNVLLFDNNRQGVTVKAGDTELYSMGAQARTTKLSATGYQVVRLPEPVKPYKLEISFSNLKDGSCQTSPVIFGSMDDVLVFLGMKSFFTLAVTPIWLLLAVALIILMLLLLFNSRPDHRPTCLSVFLLLVVCWNFTDAPFSCLFPVDGELLSSISYFMLMLMPLPMFIFVSLSCSNKKAPFVNLALLVVMVSIVTQCALFAFGVTSLYNTLPVSQALLFLALIYGIVCMALDYAKNKSRISFFQLLTTAATTLIALSTIFAYWLGGTVLYQIMFQIALLFFLIASFFIITYSLLQRRYDVRVMDAEINALKTLAVIDQLTGLANRRGFDQKLEQVQKLDDMHTNAILVFLDVNGLKYANDKFGHLAGDELLIAASHAINHAFSEVGSVYRIGGDEFAVVIDDASINLNERYAAMDEYISRHNETATTPLSIARGSSALVNSHGVKGSISDWKMRADKDMYKDKVQSRLLSASGSASDYLEIISSFVSAVDAKDSYTADHSERVAVLADSICDMLGVSDTSTDQIHIAACLHDIGKIGIPDSILLKPGSLSAEEYGVIQSHTVIGEDIVKHTKAFYEVSQIIRHHHERFDGSGYPDGISGDEIPFGSRVIAIADSIDAITSNRSYRDAKTLAYCKDEIDANLGKMYDPAIGAIVIENWGKIETIILTEHIAPAE